jgi:hypothetical protein
MTRLHRAVIRRLAGANGAPSDVTAAVIDTPFGFQENADQLSAELLDYFGRRLGMKASLASYRRADEDILDRETAFARVRAADFVFSGPGSPSYAVQHWNGSAIKPLFESRLEKGGALVLASAAALTVGRVAAPVYEIYKCGADPYWMPGLDVLAAIGIHAAVIPHFDNHDGSGHDTRFCFLGERRFRVLEEQLAAEVSVIGIDEHTALLIDVDEDRASVHGRGQVTLRHRGVAREMPAGTDFALDRLRSADSRPTTPEREAPPAPAQETSPETPVSDAAASALARRTLQLEARVAELDERARRTDALIETLVELRQLARDRGDYATADLIRDRLADLGLDLRDNPNGSTSY